MCPDWLSMAPGYPREPEKYSYQFSAGGELLESCGIFRNLPEYNLLSWKCISNHHSAGRGKVHDHGGFRKRSLLRNRHLRLLKTAATRRKAC